MICLSYVYTYCSLFFKKYFKPNKLTVIRFKMKVSNLKSKQRQMNRALQSIAIPFHNQKAVTEGYDLVEENNGPLL